MVAALVIGYSIWNQVGAGQAHDVSGDNARPGQATPGVWQAGVSAGASGERPALAAQHVAGWRGMLSDGVSREDFEDRAFGKELYAILSNDRELAVFDHFYKRPLLDKDERALYNEMLADADMLDKVRQGLLIPNEDEMSMQGSIERFMQVDYLKAALAWDENPSRAKVIDTLEQIIKYDNMPAGMDVATMQALATVKLEVYRLLSQYAPGRVPALLASMSDTRLAKLVQFMAEHTSELEAQEEALAVAPRAQ